MCVLVEGDRPAATCGQGLGAGRQKGPLGVGRDVIRSGTRNAQLSHPTHAPAHSPSYTGHHERPWARHHAAETAAAGDAYARTRQAARRRQRAAETLLQSRASGGVSCHQAG